MSCFILSLGSKLLQYILIISLKNSFVTLTNNIQKNKSQRKMKKIMSLFPRVHFLAQPQTDKYQSLQKKKCFHGSRTLLFRVHSPPRKYLAIFVHLLFMAVLMELFSNYFLIYLNSPRNRLCCQVLFSVVIIKITDRFEISHNIRRMIIFVFLITQVYFFILVFRPTSDWPTSK